MQADLSLTLRAGRIAPGEDDTRDQAAVEAAWREFKPKYPGAVGIGQNQLGATPNEIVFKLSFVIDESLSSAFQKDLLNVFRKHGFRNPYFQ
jgi:hypothetical protein